MADGWLLPRFPFCQLTVTNPKHQVEKIYKMARIRSNISVFPPKLLLLHPNNPTLDQRLREIMTPIASEFLVR